MWIQYTVQTTPTRLLCFQKPQGEIASVKLLVGYPRSKTVELPLGSSKTMHGDVRARLLQILNSWTLLSTYVLRTAIFLSASLQLSPRFHSSARGKACAETRGASPGCECACGATPHKPKQARQSVVYKRVQRELHTDVRLTAGQRGVDTDAGKQNSDGSVYAQDLLPILSKVLELLCVASSSCVDWLLLGSQLVSLGICPSDKSSRHAILTLRYYIWVGGTGRV